MKFRITALRMEIEVAGWRGCVNAKPEEFSSLHDAEIRGGHAETYAIEMDVKILSTKCKVTVPLSIVCLPGRETISIDVPEYITAVIDGVETSMRIHAFNFWFINMTPSVHGAHLIRTGTPGPTPQ